MERPRLYSQIVRLRTLPAKCTYCLDVSAAQLPRDPDDLSVFSAVPQDAVCGMDFVDRRRPPPAAMLIS